MKISTHLYTIDIYKLMYGIFEIGFLAVFFPKFSTFLGLEPKTQDSKLPKNKAKNQLVTTATQSKLKTNPAKVLKL